METGKVNRSRHYQVPVIDNAIAVMLMETFDRLTRKEKFVWDVSGLVGLYVQILTRLPTDIRPRKERTYYFHTKN